MHSKYTSVFTYVCYVLRSRLLVFIMSLYMFSCVFYVCIPTSLQIGEFFGYTLDTLDINGDM